MSARADPAARPLAVGQCRLVALDVHGDGRGNLVAIEGGGVLGQVARVYYIYGTPTDAERGFHGHRALEQLMICVAGACTLTVDDGVRRADVRLDRPDAGLYVSPMIWREMRDFSDDCVLMVVASRPYEPDDYIWDHAEFRSIARAQELPE